MVLLLSALQILGCFFLLALLPYLLLLSHKKKELKRLNLPPGPWRLPIIGNIHQLGMLPHRSLRQLAEKHGPLLYLQLGRVPTIIASSVQTATEILKNQDLAFCDRPRFLAFRRFSYGGQNIAMSPYNEQWRKAKKIATVELFTLKRVQSFRTVREEEVSILMRTIARASLQGPVHLGEMFICMYNNIIGREVFSRRISEDNESGRSKHQDLVLEMIRLMGGFCVGDFFPSMEWLHVLSGGQAEVDRNFYAMDEFLRKEIESHMKDIDHNQESEQSDFCSILLRLQDESSLTRDQLKGILMDMFIGGTETSASTLEWTMAELAMNPRVMKKAQDEVRRVSGTKGKVEESDLDQLHFLKMVLKEIFRLHPLTLLPHACREACQINGYDIPVKAAVFVNAWAIGRDPEYWENPEEFRPERFEGSSVDYKGQHMLLLPFGAGRRMCPGLSLGSVGVELALANLLYCFNWDLPDGKKDVDMTEVFGIAIRMKSPLVLQATPVALG